MSAFFRKCRGALLCVLTGALLLALPGCGGGGTPEPTPTPTDALTATPTATAAPSATPTPTATATPTPAKQTIAYYTPGGNENGVALAIARIFQGVLNRKEARVWIADSISAHGVNVSAVSEKLVRQYGNVRLKATSSDGKSAHAAYGVFWALWRDFGAEIERIYIFDTDEALRDTLNIAAFLAGQNNGVAVTRELYDAMEAEDAVGARETVDVKALCGFDGTTDRLSANRWIEAHLADSANPEIVFLLCPGGRGGDDRFYPAAYDTAVAKGALIYWIDPTAAGAAEVQASILAHFEPGTPVAGWAGLNMEQAYVEAISACGKSVVCIDWGFANGSVYGSFAEYTPTECTSTVAETGSAVADSEKIYVTFTVSDGDAWHYATKELIAFWESKTRGEFPLAWTIPSLFMTYHPALLSYLYSSRTENDSLLQGPSGEGYVYPSLMSDEDFTEFCLNTYDTLQTAGLNMVNYWDADDRYYTADNRRLVEFVETVEPDAVFLGHKSEEGGYFMIGDTVCMQELGALRLRGTQTAAEIVAAIDRAAAATPDGEPVFAAVNVEAWGEGISTVAEAWELLSEREDADRYAFVSAATITALIRQYMENK